MGTNRLYAYAKAWLKEGHHVTILTTKKYQYDGKANLFPNDPYYKKMEIIEVPYASWFTQYFEFKESGETVLKTQSKLYYLKLLVRNIRQKFIGLIFDIHDLWIYKGTKIGIEILEKKEYAFVLSSFAPAATHAIASNLKKNTPSLFWVADYRDLWSGNPYFQNKTVFNFWQKKKEKKLLDLADLITTVSAPWQQYLEQFLNKETLLVPNGYDADEIDTLDKTILYPNNNIRRFIYTGTLYPEKQNIKPLFKALQKLVLNNIIDNNFELYLYGDTGDIDNLIVQYNLKDIVIKKGFVTRETSLRAQRDADGLLYLGWEDKEATSLSSMGVLSAKVFEYIASGTEIFAIGGRKDSEASQYILQTKRGHIYEDDEALIYNNIKRVIQDGKKKLTEDIELLHSIRRETRAKELLLKIQERL